MYLHVILFHVFGFVLVWVFYPKGQAISHSVSRWVQTVSAAVGQFKVVPDLHSTEEFL